MIDVVRTAARPRSRWCCKEAADGGWTVSTRSKGGVDVGAAAVALGGGGHRFAAGFTSDDRRCDADRWTRLRRRARRPAPHLPGVTGARARTGWSSSTSRPAGPRTTWSARVRRLAGTRRVGHAGTLDPMATGVLVLGVEQATRLLGHLALTDKAYDGDDPARPGRPSPTTPRARSTGGSSAAG